jgi:glucose-1-phosphate thymidylyltransferase
MRHPYGPAFTLDAAYPFVRGATVAIGFPDIVFQPADAYTHCLARLGDGGADIVLGLVPFEQPEIADMVDVDEAGRVRDIVIKQPAYHLRYSWVVAMWGPAFTEFMHAHLAEALQQLDPAQEWHVGRVVQAALQAGLRVDSVTFPEGGYVDYGSPDALRRLYAAGSVNPIERT